tara:strand:- start:1689 stop:2138 length:450 start_codon:yes stop_codon:yes gene_type:complete
MNARTKEKQQRNSKENKFLNEEEKEQRHQEEVNWGKYFDSIATVCPWSKKYYMQDKILHAKVGKPGTELTFVAGFCASNHKALLLEYNEGTTIDTLLTVVDKIESKYLHLAAFWSHPDEKENNTPTPCVIVQDKQELTDLRKQIGYKDD